MAYESRPTGNRLGIYADKIEKKRDAAGLDDKGFRLDGTDPAAADKEAMLRSLYERADSRLPPGIGGTIPAPSAKNAPASEAEGSEENDDTEDD